jgi:hypothetical protein
MGDLYETLRFILAMFDDGSSEGDFEIHKIIADSREASRLQIERINAIIENTLLSIKANPGKATEQEWIEQIISEIAQLPDRGPPDKPSMAMGLSGIKQDTLRLLGSMREWAGLRHKDAARAVSALNHDAVIIDASDLLDGLTRIVRHHETLIGKRKAK